jgi:hypothetical protein
LFRNSPISNQKERKTKMENKVQQQRIVIAIIIALLLISTVGAFIYRQSNQSLKSDLRKEKLSSEAILSEKLAIEKESLKLKNDIQTWMGKSKKTDSMLEDALAKIQGMEKTIAGLRRENSAMALLKKEFEALKEIRDQLEKQMALNESKSSKKITDLQSELESAKGELNQLRAALHAKPDNLTDVFRVESSRGKQKPRLTVNAARTKRLVLSFEIPESLSNDITFNIITPQGRTIKSGQTGLTVRILDDNRNLTASLSPVSGSYEISKRMEMTYKPDKKLESGVYQVYILHNNHKIGSCQLKLR